MTSEGKKFLLIFSFLIFGFFFILYSAGIFIASELKVKEECKNTTDLDECKDEFYKNNSILFGLIFLILGIVLLLMTAFIFYKLKNSRDVIPK